MLSKADLIAYVGAVHARSYEAVAILRDEDLAWRPRPGEFAAGELALHIANTRRMTAGAIEGLGWHYRGHAPGATTTAASLRQALLRASKKTIAVLHGADLAAPVVTLAKAEAPGWRLVVSGLIEHEVHHRAQLCEYLSALGREAPALYGLHVEALP